MHSFRRLLLAGCLGLSIATSALAADPYVTGKMMDIATLIPPPPIQDSPEDKADLQTVISAQAQANAARKAQALYDSDESIFVVFGKQLGEKFQPDALPHTTELFARIGASEDDTLDAAKPAFARLRPWIGHKDTVTAIAKPTKSGSYPSGHTTRVTIYAIVMSAMVPEKQREFWLRAEDYTQSRVIGGMHYPSDIAAGWRAGTAMAAVMMAQPGFRADMDAARVELRGVLGIPAK